MLTLKQLADTDFTIEPLMISSCVWKNGVVLDNRENGREHCLIHLITEGFRQYMIGDTILTLRPGTLLFIPHGTRYATVPYNDCAGIGICFDMTAEGKLLEIMPDVYHEWNDPYGEYKTIMETMQQDFKHTPSRCLHRKAMLWSLLDKMLRECTDMTELGQIIAPALRHMEMHYRDNQPIADYAAICCLSESHFRRKFIAYTGMTPVEYRDSLRFEEAHRLLAQGMCAARIAEQVGFCDASYMRRLYRKRTGRHFRRQHLPEIT